MPHVQEVNSLKKQLAAQQQQLEKLRVARQVGRAGQGRTRCGAAL